MLYEQTALRFEFIFPDSTGVKANIHFPVDWVLLRDAARTLVQSIMLIRQQGLRHRIGDPKQFIKKMNKPCIEMTHARKKKDAKKMRKKILRRMKKLMKTGGDHAVNYRTLLKENWQETEWSELETQADGLIADWDFMKDQPKADCKIVKPSLTRITKQYGTPASYTGDRGFDAAANDFVLEELDVINAICPKSVPALREKLADEQFCLLQT